MNDELNASILEGIDLFKKKYPEIVKPDSSTQIDVEAVLKALDEFMECVRYLNTRRSSGAILKLNDEPAVQDTLYLMLRPWIRDLVPENPTDKVANRYSIKDFLVKSARTVIEVKFIRNGEHGKSVVKELNDDIETYRYHPFCDNLIFFIYDPDANIPDVASLRLHVSEPRTYPTKTLRCHVIVKP